MKKFLKIGCLSIIGLFVLLTIIVLSFSKSDDYSKTSSSLIINNTESLYKEIKLSLEETNFIKANNLLGDIIKLDSTYSKIDSIRSVIEKQKEEAINTINKEETTLKSYIYEDKDDFQKINWIQPRSEKGKFRNTIYSYFGINDNSIINNPRLVIRYLGDDWLFWDKVVFLIDGETYNYFPANAPKRDNNSKVWETSDEAITESLLNILEIAFKAKSVKYRLVGNNKVKDFTLSKTKIKSIQNILQYKYILDNKSKLNITVN